MYVEVHELLFLLQVLTLRVAESDGVNKPCVCVGIMVMVFLLTHRNKCSAGWCC